MVSRWHFALLWEHLTYRIGWRTRLKTDVASPDHPKMDCKPFLLKLDPNYIILSVSFCSEMDRSIEYGCNPGFNMVGDRKSATCQDGIWSPAAPSCVDIDECITKPGICGEKECVNKIGGFECKEEEDGECVILRVSLVQNFSFVGNFLTALTYYF